MKQYCGLINKISFDRVITKVQQGEVDLRTVKEDEG